MNQGKSLIETKNGINTGYHENKVTNIDQFNTQDSERHSHKPINISKLDINNLFVNDSNQYFDNQGDFPTMKFF